MKWQTLKEELDNYVIRFCQLGESLNHNEEIIMQYFRLSIPPSLYLYLARARTIPEVVENLKEGIALGGLESLTPQINTTFDDQRPIVPFMTKEETFKVVQYFVEDSIYKGNRELIKTLTRIGDKLNLVKDFQKDRSRSRFGSDYDDYCKICGKKSHITNRCWHLKDLKRILNN